MTTSALLRIFAVLFFYHIGIVTAFSQSGRIISDSSHYALVIHGGAGNIYPHFINDSMQAEYEKALLKAINIGDSILSNNGSALDAAVYSVQFLEDCPLFNAGKGAVLNSDGKAELDASVMDGQTLNAGAVACVTSIKNPVLAARYVMEHSGHVMLAGPGADLFAKNNGLEIVDASYFITGIRMQQYLMNKKKNDSIQPDEKKGTVGAVALDKSGNLAAATSTGGISFKKYGRVGDSPLIGAGTYANNLSCAVSCTGHGEYFIRQHVAGRLSDMMLYGNYTLEKAAKEIVHSDLIKAGADGGLIAVDKNGNYIMVFNTAGMFRAYLDENGKAKVLMFKSE